MKKVIVAHPFKQHSFELARALEKQGILVKYCTTVYDKPDSLMKYVEKLLSAKWRIKANNRKSDSIPDEKVQLFCEIRGFIALLINHFSTNINFTRLYQRYLYRSFGRCVAKYAETIDADAVILFDTTATECFDRLSNSGIKKILDMAAVSRKYARHIYEKEQEKSGLTYFYETQRYLWDNSILDYMNKEIELADFFITASQFTKRSLEFCGVEKPIAVIPYGVDFDKFYPDAGQEKRTDSVLRIVFAGHVDYQKGLHHLFSALKLLTDRDIILDVYGVYSENDSVYALEKTLPNVHFHGHVSSDVLREVYQNSDIMVFPSTNDGYGLVVLEALACGLPVICSRNAGACDVIEDGVNGFCFNSGDVCKLYELIQWCCNNMGELEKMSINAYKSVQELTWDMYDEKVGKYIDSL